MRGLIEALPLTQVPSFCAVDGVQQLHKLGFITVANEGIAIAARTVEMNAPLPISVGSIRVGLFGHRDM